MRPEAPPVEPFPTTEGAYQRDPGLGCGGRAATPYSFVVKFRADGRVIYSTLLGGSYGNALAVDATGNAYLAGRTGNGLPFPVTPGAFQTQAPTAAGFVAKLNATGSALLYATYFSGSLGAPDNQLKLAVDAQGRAHLTGAVSDGSFVTTTRTSPFDATRGAFLTRFNAAGTALEESVILGDQTTAGRGLALDAVGNVYLTGNVSSARFPTTTGAFQSQHAGESDAFLCKFGAEPLPRAIVNLSAASYAGVVLPAASIAVAFGQELATTRVSATTNPLPTTLAGSSVKVRDSAGVERLAPLFFVSPSQINYLVPPESAPGAALVTSTNAQGATSIGRIQLDPVAPGIFTADASGRGVAAAVALCVGADGSQRYLPVARFDEATQRLVAVPIAVCQGCRETYLILFGTGWRQRSALSGVAARLSNTLPQVVFAGAQGDLIGLDQLNLLLPRELCGQGDVPVSLVVDDRASNVVRVTIQ